MTASDPVAAAKRQIRQAVTAARSLVDVEEQSAGADRLAANVVALTDAVGARVVCAYVSMAGEPGSRPLIELLHARGVRVLLPLLLPDLALDWAAYSPGVWRRGRFGIVEPTSPALGVDAVAEAEVVICPGVAGSPSGARLGRGGGSYDRALGRSSPACLRCLLLYDHEVLADVPTEGHDQRVDVIVTPASVVWTSARRR